MPAKEGERRVSDVEFKTIIGQIIAFTDNPGPFLSMLEEIAFYEENAHRIEYYINESTGEVRWKPIEKKIGFLK